MLWLNLIWPAFGMGGKIHKCVGGKCLGVHPCKSHRCMYGQLMQQDACTSKLIIHIIHMVLFVQKFIPQWSDKKHWIFLDEEA